MFYATVHQHDGTQYTRSFKDEGEFAFFVADYYGCGYRGRQVGNTAFLYPPMQEVE